MEAHYNGHTIRLTPLPFMTHAGDWTFSALVVQATGCSDGQGYFSAMDAVSAARTIPSNEPERLSPSGQTDEWILSPLRFSRLSFNRISARLRLSAAPPCVDQPFDVIRARQRTGGLEKLLKKPDELFDDLIDRLNFHLNSEASIHHGNYKADLFRLCQEAYVNGYFEPSSEVRFTGQSLNSRLSERWTKGNEKRQQLLDSLFPMWNEWHYALEMCTKP